MPSVSDLPDSLVSKIEDQIKSRHEQEGTFHDLPGWLFKDETIYLHKSPSNPDSAPSFPLHLASKLARFGGASLADKLEDKHITHILVDSDSCSADISTLRTKLSKRVGTNQKIPHIVNVGWVTESWKEKTLLDEERI